MALFGLLNINKPAGVTSRDVVDRVERLTWPVRCGHAGTLDPLASGVLVICVGAATRLIQYVQRMPKKYVATFELGCQSTTDDIEGDVTRLEGAPRPTREQIEAALPAFLGTIQQRPPNHSAVKVAGRRAYKLARQGKPLDLAPRPVTIHSLVLRRYEYPELELDMECGSGTYVRSLGRDLAANLGTAAVMSDLVRTAIGGFRVEDATRVDDLSKDELLKHLRPALEAVADLSRISVNAAELSKLRSGLPVAIPSSASSPAGSASAEWAVVDSSGSLAAIASEKKPGELWPVLNLV